jgi:hypothetical protein
MEEKGLPGQLVCEDSLLCLAVYSGHNLFVSCPEEYSLKSTPDPFVTLHFFCILVAEVTCMSQMTQRETKTKTAAEQPFLSRKLSLKSPDFLLLSAQWLIS